MSAAPIAAIIPAAPPPPGVGVRSERLNSQVSTLFVVTGEALPGGPGGKKLPLLLSPPFCLQPLEVHVGEVHERHRIRDGPVACDVPDLPPHLLRDGSIRHVALGRGAK